MFPFTMRKKVLISDGCEMVDFRSAHKEPFTPLRKKLLVARAAPFHLNLSGSNVRNEDLEFLEGLEFLRGLDLTHCMELTDTAVETLLRMKQLESLRVGGSTKISPEMFDQLQAGIPDCQVLKSRTQGQTFFARFMLVLLWIILTFSLITAIVVLSRSCMKPGMPSTRSVEITCPPDATDEVLAELIRSQPDISALRMKGCSRITDDGLVCLEGLKGLFLIEATGCSGLTDKGMVHLARINSLYSLDLNECPRLTVDGLKVFVSHPGLCHLGLPDQVKTDTGLIALSRFVCGAANRYVDFARWDISDKSLEFISKNEMVDTVELVGNKHITDRGISQLAKCRNLRVLCLNDLSITGFGSIEPDGFRKLTRLTIQDCPRLKAEGLAFLTGCSMLNNITIDQFDASRAKQLALITSLSDLTITGDLRTLDLAPFMSRNVLARLRLQSCVFQGQRGILPKGSFVPLASIKTRTIECVGLKLTPEDFADLGKIKSLEYLNLFNTEGISQETIKSLENLTRLRELGLRDCSGVTDDVLDILANHPSLVDLIISGSKGPTRKGIIRFRRNAKSSIIFDKSEIQ